MAQAPPAPIELFLFAISVNKKENVFYIQFIHPFVYDKIDKK